jgi:hypothetical protein
MSVNVNTSTNTITIQQDGTRVIQVNTLGPQGQQGLQGDSIFTNISGNIWATTSSLQISNSLDLSGSLIAPKITGSLLGTSSWAENALTASFVTTAQTASYVQTAQTASYTLQSVSSSFATTASYVSSNFQYEIHVSQVDGNDTTGDGSLLKPVSSITKALTLITGQRRTIVIHPGSYTENPSITTQYTVLTTFEPLGGNTAIIGTVSTSVGCTIAGLTIQNLTITTGTGVGVPNIINCNISGTLTKSGNATFTDIHNCNIDTACNITGTGLVTINDGNPNFVTVNNAGANVIIKNVMSCVSPSVTAGTLNITDSIVIAAVTNAVTSNPSSVVTLANSQLLTSALNTVAPVSLSGFYSIFNCVFDKPNSTLVALSGTGGSTNSIDYFQYINADNITSTNGLTVTGSLKAPSITGSLQGTSSWANNTQTASFVTTAQTASYVLNAVSSSFASTSSYLNILNQNLIITGSTNTTGSSFTWNNNQVLTTPSATTGTVVTFTANQIYNEWDIPGTGNITADLTGAKTGIVQKIYHNNTIAPSVPAEWVVVSNGVYVPNVLNIIYAEWVKGTRVEYWITQ